MDDFDKFHSIKLSGAPSLKSYSSSDGNFVHTRPPSSALTVAPDLDRDGLEDKEYVKKPLPEDDLKVEKVPSFYNAQALDESPNIISVKMQNKNEERTSQAPLTATDNKTSNQDKFSFDFRKSSHPFVCFFTAFFKAAAITLYIILNWIIDDYIATFIAVSILLSMDFWVLKNISGRLLVGLKWYIIIELDGSEIWKYETKNTESKASRIDYVVFWYFQILSLLFWIAVLILNIITFSFGWACLDIFCIVLVATNLVLFFRCSKVHQARLKGAARNVAQEAAKQTAKNYIHQAVQA